MDIPASHEQNADQVAYWNGPAGQRWAERQTAQDIVLKPIADLVIDRAKLKPGERVIDIGCGSGTTVIELAKRVGTGGSVFGSDISKQSVEKANERIAAAGLRQASVSVSDVSTYAFPDASFDLAFSRFGVMFFSDPTATFSRFRRAMVPNGRLAFAVFRTPKENPWGTAPVAAVRHLLPPLPQLGPEDPGQFAWADPERVRRILAGAGFQEISLTPYDPVMRLAGPGGAAEAADFAMRVGPVARAMSTGSVKDPDAVRAGLAAFFASHDSPQGIRLPGALWFVGARA